MAGSLRIAGVMVSSILAIAFLPAVANAATYYAKPGGPASGGCASPATGCDFEYAVEVVSGPTDTVRVMPGVHVLGAMVNVVAIGDTIEGMGPDRPTIAKDDIAVPLGLQNGGSITDLSIVAPAALGLNIRGSTVRRVAITAAYGISVEAGSSVMTDSTVTSQGPSGYGINVAGSTVGDAIATVRNVTAVATGSSSQGIRVAPACPIPPPTCHDATMDAANVVARGTSLDLLADDDVFGSASGTIEIASSNYRTSGGTGTITDAGGNQTAAAQTADDAVFGDLVGGDLRPPPGSPLIDAGADTPENGEADVDGDPRAQGEAIDIGAYEATPAPEPPPDPPTAEDLRPTPDTTLTRSPKKKVTTRKKRKRLVYKFASPLAGSVFECAFGKSGWKPCASPYKKKVKAKRGKKAKKYVFKVRAVTDQNVLDPTPAKKKTKVKRKPRNRQK